MVDVIGWSGAVLLLVAYALVSGKRLGGASARYQLLNVAGAVLLIVNSACYGAYPSAALNVVWAIVGLVALTRKGEQAGCGNPRNEPHPSAPRDGTTRPAHMRRKPPVG